MKIAVITGASSGMGKEFVYAIDKEFNLDEIWVIARREEKLKELGEKCRAKVRPLHPYATLTSGTLPQAISTLSDSMLPVSSPAR